MESGPSSGDASSHRKISFPIDKREWHPSLIPGPLVLISTVDTSGTPNLAPKSWVQMVAFDPPTLMFSGTRGNPTEDNALATGCFAVNVVSGSLAGRVFGCIRWRGEERIRRSGFRLTPADAIAAPLVDDCRAHLECRLHSTQEVGSGFVLFGEIVAASIREDLVEGEPRARYAALDPALFMEDGLYATADWVAPAEPEELSDHFIRFVILLSHERPELLCEELVRAHVAHLKRLEDQGRLELAGPFPGHAGGMVILRATSEREARAIAEADPFVSSGAETYELRRLEVSCRDNNHLGMG